MIGTSIIFEPVWDRLQKYLHVVAYTRDRGHDEPRIRIEFLDLPDTFSRELVRFEMECVACGRPNHPLRRRVGDDFDRLYYAPTCELSKRISCSRGRAAALEYQRFIGIDTKRPTSQLDLF